MTLRRRTLLQAGAAAGTAALAGFAGHAFAQARTKLRVGYLHTPAVDGQIWLGQQSGAWSKRGLDLELIQFTTGLELFQAMIGGKGQFRVKASKGVHVLVPRDRIDSDTGLITETEKSLLFIIPCPWSDEFWIIGTTDTPWNLHLAHPAASRTDSLPAAAVLPGW